MTIERLRALVVELFDAYQADGWRDGPLRDMYLSCCHYLWHREQAEQEARQSQKRCERQAKESAPVVL